MTDKLSVYNGALSVLSEPPLVSLTENRASRRTLDSFYNQAVNYCLEDGQWTFAQRLLKLDAATDITPAFGHIYFFEKPSDFVKLCGIWQDENLLNPMGSAYDLDKQGWYASIDAIYVKYVSNDVNFGFDLNSWSSSFTRYVQVYLALLSVSSITGSKADKAEIFKELQKASRDAKNVDSWDKPVRRLPRGSWVSARHGSSARYRRENG